ncbi:MULTISPECIES: LPS translocon maturation chaperone LptM [unclassified Avibacterium]|nr:MULTISPECIES: lipoprotein [unclassified Avibacterium]MCW9699218.1 lipoprotein [Avibacterium sp. 20-129]MCW9715423.1 lipoprotein [Avibacterium sp. 21-594]MCW9717580.1 lipoprotein [Avibacterium sp. 21-599]URL06608.1 lipoprotein [Avibacterium sp. 21-595]
MKKLIFILTLGAVTLSATACGVKGPLYFPEQQHSQTQQ